MKINNLIILCPTKRLGITLIELLVVILLGLIVTGLAFAIYLRNSHHYYESEATLQAQRNLRVALSTLTREIRMAGNGMFVLGPGLSTIQVYAPTMASRACNSKPIITDTLAWYKNCDEISGQGVRAIFGEDGDSDSSDVITIFKAEPEFSQKLGTLSDFSGDEIVISSGIDEEAVMVGDLLGIINDDYEAVVMEVESITDSGAERKIKINKNGRYTSPNILPSGYSSRGIKIFNLKDVVLASYYVDEASNRLMVVYHDQKINPLDPKVSPPIVIAENIEDLQFYYYFDNEEVDNAKLVLDPGISSDKLKNHSIVAISVGLTAKTTYSQNLAPQVRPALFNRSIGTTSDKFDRISIMETVNLRNATK
ncbi:MAG: hypothetical protein LBT38_10990 [Deltaproteobacteria bacterium]|jgi:hypothetical protein|nr:hypothetical protein [Deltaproteobacteria bacterium]